MSVVDNKLVGEFWIDSSGSASYYSIIDRDDFPDNIKNYIFNSSDYNYTNEYRHRAPSVPVPGDTYNFHANRYYYDFNEDAFNSTAPNAITSENSILRAMPDSWKWNGYYGAGHPVASFNTGIYRWTYASYIPAHYNVLTRKKNDTQLGQLENFGIFTGIDPSTDSSDVFKDAVFDYTYDDRNNLWNLLTKNSSTHHVIKGDYVNPSNFANIYDYTADTPGEISANIIRTIPICRNSFVNHPRCQAVRDDNYYYIDMQNMNVYSPKYSVNAEFPDRINFSKENTQGTVSYGPADSKKYYIALCNEIKFQIKYCSCNVDGQKEEKILDKLVYPLNYYSNTNIINDIIHDIFRHLDPGKYQYETDKNYSVEYSNSKGGISPVMHIHNIKLDNIPQDCQFRIRTLNPTVQNELYEGSPYTYYQFIDSSITSNDLLDQNDAHDLYLPLSYVFIDLRDLVNPQNNEYSLKIIRLYSFRIDIEEHTTIPLSILQNLLLNLTNNFDTNSLSYINNVNQLSRAYYNKQNPGSSEWTEDVSYGGDTVNVNLFDYYNNEVKEKFHNFIYSQDCIRIPFKRTNGLTGITVKDNDGENYNLSYIDDQSTDEFSDGSSGVLFPLTDGILFRNPSGDEVHNIQPVLVRSGFCYAWNDNFYGNLPWQDKTRSSHTSTEDNNFKCNADYITDLDKTHTENGYATSVNFCHEYTAKVSINLDFGHIETFNKIKTTISNISPQNKMFYLGAYIDSSSAADAATRKSIVETYNRYEYEDCRSIWPLEKIEPYEPYAMDDTSPKYYYQYVTSQEHHDFNYKNISHIHYYFLNTSINDISDIPSVDFSIEVDSSNYNVSYDFSKFAYDSSYIADSHYGCIYPWSSYHDLLHGWPTENYQKNTPNKPHLLNSGHGHGYYIEDCNSTSPSYLKYGYNETGYGAYYKSPIYYNYNVSYCMPTWTDASAEVKSPDYNITKNMFNYGYNCFGIPLFTEKNTFNIDIISSLFNDYDIEKLTENTPSMLKYISNDNLMKSLERYYPYESIYIDSSSLKEVVQNLRDSRFSTYCEEYNDKIQKASKVTFKHVGKPYMHDEVDFNNIKPVFDSYKENGKSFIGYTMRVPAVRLMPKIQTVEEFEQGVGEIGYDFYFHFLFFDISPKDVKEYITKPQPTISLFDLYSGNELSSMTSITPKRYNKLQDASLYYGVINAATKTYDTGRVEELLDNWNHINFNPKKPGAPQSEAAMYKDWFKFWGDGPLAQTDETEIKKEDIIHHLFFGKEQIYDYNDSSTLNDKWNNFYNKWYAQHSISTSTMKSYVFDKQSSLIFSKNTQFPCEFFLAPNKVDEFLTRVNDNDEYYTFTRKEIQEKNMYSQDNNRAILKGDDSYDDQKRFELIPDPEFTFTSYYNIDTSTKLYIDGSTSI